MTWHLTEASAEHLRQTMSTAGGLLVGRRPHTVPDGWPREGIPYTFVSSRFQEAVAEAEKLAGSGIRLLDHLKAALMKLERARVIEGDGVTHLYFNVLPRPDY